MKDKILKIIEECKDKGRDDMHFKEDREYLANALAESGLFKSDEMNLLDLFKLTDEDDLIFGFATTSGFYNCTILNKDNLIRRVFAKETPIYIMQLTIKDAIKKLKASEIEEVEHDSRTDEVSH